MRMHDVQLIEQFVTPYKNDLVGLVRAIAAIPWGEGRTVEDVLETKCVGTCTGKHLVLQQSLAALDIPFRTVACTFRWGEQDIKFPEHLQEILNEGEWEHGHNFVQIQHNDTWIDVDVTWDAALASYGFRTFPQNWDGTISFVGVDPIIERWDGADVAEKKHALIHQLDAETQDRRQRFLDGFISWIASVRS